jgi:hypothetical protein
MRKRIGGLGNVITAAFTVIFIIFAVIGENIAPSEEDVAEANEYLNYVEETVSIDLPEFDMIEYDVYEDGSQNIYIYISDDEKIEELHAYFAKEAKFFKTAPSSYLGLLPVFSRSNDQDFGLIYNVTTGEVNTMPKSDGSYTMIYINFYDYRDGTAALYIEEYVIDYTSDFSK